MKFIKNFFYNILVKILLIFVIGFFTRVMINYIYDINVFKGCALYVCIFYYSSLICLFGYLDGFSKISFNFLNYDDIRRVMTFLFSRGVFLKTENYSDYQNFDKFTESKISKPLFVERNKEIAKDPIADKLFKGKDKYGGVMRPCEDDVKKFTRDSKCILTDSDKPTAICRKIAGQPNRSVIDTKELCLSWAKSKGYSFNSDGNLITSNNNSTTSSSSNNVKIKGEDNTNDIKRHLGFPNGNTPSNTNQYIYSANSSSSNSSIVTSSGAPIEFTWYDPSSANRSRYSVSRPRTKGKINYPASYSNNMRGSDSNENN